MGQQEEVQTEEEREGVKKRGLERDVQKDELHTEKTKKTIILHFISSFIHPFKSP